MLDENISQQLRQVFGSLSSRFTLVVQPSTHEKAQELVELAQSLAATSPNIEAVVEGPQISHVNMTLLKDGKPTGVSFRGIPGGHEFTSLVLAVLNADGKGKQPDDGVKARVRALKGPAALRTYVSLSCTNCPDVVQALNLMAFLNPDLSHELVDGELAPEEVERLKLQGVPSVFVGDKLLHVGKSSLAELVEVLENELGRDESGDAPQPVRAV